MPRAFIGIGSNIEPEANVTEALRMLSRQVKLVALSDVYLNEPQGCPGQPPFYNAVTLVETDLPPEDLKNTVLRKIEDSLGRLRCADKYAPRTIDLDLLTYDELAVSTDAITLPDPLIVQRAFLAVPLYELAEDFVMPGSDVALKDVVAAFGNHGMRPQHNYTQKLRRELLNGL